MDRAGPHRHRRSPPSSAPLVRGDSTDDTASRPSSRRGRPSARRAGAIFFQACASGAVSAASRSALPTARYVHGALHAPRPRSALRPPQHLNCLVESRYCPPVHARAHASIGQVRLKLSSFFLFIIPSLNHAHVYYSLSSLCDLAKVRAAWAGGRAGIRMRDADGAGREFEGGLGGPACARMHHHGQRAFPVHVGAGFTGEQLLRYAFPGLSQSWMASRAHNGRNGTRVAARFVGLSTDGYSGRAPSSCTHSSDGAPRV